MDLKITDCQATPSSITLVFSTNGMASVTSASFTVFDPAVSSAPIQPSNASITGNLAKLALSPLTPLNVGDQILVSVTGIVLSPVSPEPPTPLAIGTVVKSLLQIVNGVATPTLVVIYFSENLNTSTPPGASTSPSNASNYTIQSAGGPLLNPASAVYDDSIQATFLQFGPNILQWGQELTITVNNVTDVNGTPIGNGGSNTVYARVGSHDRDGGSGGDGLSRRETKEVTESVEDAVAYPVLTEQVSFSPSSGGGAPTTGALTPVPAGAALATSAAKAVTDVLGWKANSSDPKGFIGALTQAFTLTEVEGHVEATWNPRTYAVQTDLGGGISGAQAVLYSRAKNALDQCLPLLNGLYPLDPDADPEYVKALREMATSQINAIVTELGTVGGPSVLRINTYFGILLGTTQPITFSGPGATVPQFDPDQIQGTLGELRDTFGIYFQKASQNNPYSNSIQDEQNITNFRVISDYMTSLLQSWISNGQFFVLGTQNQPAFFGTQLVLISRQFSVIAETVNELRFALDSVFIGPSERQTLLLQLATNPAIFLEDMLQQVEAFVSDEGPGLLQNGGRISVTNNVLPVMKSFFGMVREARRPVNVRQLPDGYRTVRVQRAIDDLRDQISELINLVQPIGQQLPAAVQVPEPIQVLFVTPNNPVPSSTPVTLTIAGTGFEEGATCSLAGLPPQPKSGGSQGTPSPVTVRVSGPQFATENLLFAQVSIAGGTAGFVYPYTVIVNNPDGTSASLRAGLAVTP